MIRYLPAIGLPGLKPWAGVSSGRVRDATSGPAGPNGAPQSLQNFAVSLFSAWHLGHSVMTFPASSLTGARWARLRVGQQIADDAALSAADRPAATGLIDPMVN